MKAVLITAIAVIIGLVVYNLVIAKMINKTA